MRSDTPHHFVRAIFIVLIGEKFAGLIFTNGSKSEEGVATVFTVGDQWLARFEWTGRHVATVFTAEVVGLKLAAKLVEGHSNAEKFLVCSNSLNVLQKIRNVLTNDHLVQRQYRPLALVLVGELYHGNSYVMFLCI